MYNQFTNYKGSAKMEDIKNFEIALIKLTYDNQIEFKRYLVWLLNTSNSLVHRISGLPEVQ